MSRRDREEAAVRNQRRRKIKILTALFVIASLFKGSLVDFRKPVKAVSHAFSGRRALVLAYQPLDLTKFFS